MITASNEIIAHLAGEVTNLAICWKLTLTNNTVLGFTDYTSDLKIGEIVYKASTGFSSTGIETKDTFSVDNLDITGILDSTSITESDIMAGRYDFAEVEIFMVNASDLTQGTIMHRRGWLGEVSLKGAHFIAEVRGLAQKLQHNIGEIYSPTCRAILGDKRCKVALEKYTVKGKVINATGNQVFKSDIVKQEAGHFSGGEIEWLTGSNAGCRIEIKEFSDKQFTLVLPMPKNIEAGDTFSAIAGCDKTINTCATKFKNVVNFRGEPYVPGLDKMLSTSATSNDLQRV